MMKAKDIDKVVERLNDRIDDVQVMIQAYHLLELVHVAPVVLPADLRSKLDDFFGIDGSGDGD